ncbi:hypothetical protein Holit_03014 [Hollandina sp. SP2]
MASLGRDKLSGKVEVDEAYFGGPETRGKRGRGAENKVLAAIAVETNEGKGGTHEDSSHSDLSSTSWNFWGN